MTGFVDTTDVQLEAFEENFKEHKTMSKDYWLVSTERLKDKLWFRDQEDFTAGMNLVAVEATVTGVVILAFILMSNHVHFVLAGDKSTTNSFISRLKTRYSQYFGKKYGISGLLRNNAVDLRVVRIGDESFERAVAYVQMNSVAANVCLHPSLYPWGTGDLFFSQSEPAGVKTGEMTARECIRKIHSKVPLPANYVLDRRGFIHPSSYVPVKYVESVFRTPKRMNYFLQSSSKAKQLSEGPSFSDQLLVSAVHDLSVSLYRKSSFSELETGQQAEIVKQLKYRFSSDPNQLSRITGLSYEKVCGLLDNP